LRNNFGIIKSAPVIEKFIRLTGEKKATLTFLGLEPFSEKYFRNYLNNEKVNFQTNLIPLLTRKAHVIVSERTADKFNFSVGDSIKFESDGVNYSVYLTFIIKIDNNLEAEAAENLIISDIAVAQDLFNLKNEISRIDLILEKSNDIKNIRAHLDPSLIFGTSDSRAKAGKNMTDSFRINLTAMSMLSLIVGMFLIYNTMTFSVVQRRRYIGLLRSIGVTQGEIFRLILFESLTLGIVGTLLGLIGGITLGKFLIQLVTKTINDMYFVLQVQEMYLSTFSIMKGLFLGIVATLLSALKPATEASKVPAGIAMIRSLSETNLKNKTKKFFIYGLGLVLLGFIILKFPTKNIYLSYVGVVPFLAGFALISPLGVELSIKLITPIMTYFFGSIGKLSARGISENLSRTTIAIAALSIALSAAIGIGTMVGSFRQTVVDWLNFRLKADIYASVPTNVSRFNDGSFPEWVVDSAKTISGVKAMNLYRETQINKNGMVYHLLGMSVQSFDYETFKEQITSTDQIWKKFQNTESVVISESYSYKNDANVGDTLLIPTDMGVKPFIIIAVNYDYGSDMGLIWLNLKTYRKYFNDNNYSGLGIFASKESDVEQIAASLEQKISPKLTFLVRTNKKLIQSSIDVFDRTFIITNVLQLLAIIVSFIGILSALMSLQLEKSRQFAILRANGLTPLQLWKLVIYQTGIMGLIAGIFSIPLGNIIAYILIDIINLRSFGWSINFYFEPVYLMQGLIVGILSAILAGIYPAWKMAKTPPAISLRNE